MQQIEKQFRAFLAQNQDILNPHMGLLLAVQDRLSYLNILSEKQHLDASQNRIVQHRNMAGNVSIYCDRPCKFYEIQIGSCLSQLKEKRKNIFIGADGVDELLFPHITEMRL